MALLNPIDWTPAGHLGALADVADTVGGTGGVTHRTSTRLRTQLDGAGVNGATAQVNEPMTLNTPWNANRDLIHLDAAGTPIATAYTAPPPVPTHVSRDRAPVVEADPAQGTNLGAYTTRP